MGGETSTPIPAATPSSARMSQPRMVHNYLLGWVDANVSTSNEDSQHTMQRLRSIVYDVNVFTQPEDCITFLQDIQLEKVFLIISGSFGQSLVPRIHAMTQLDAIYIFCGDKSRHAGWVKKWPKVKGVFTQIEPICEALELAVKQCDHDCIPLSFARVETNDVSKINLNQLEPSFMYTQLFKNTLLDMQHDRKKEMEYLLKYCQQAYADNPTQLDRLHEFGCDYQPEKAIWWYTREGFTYQMLNRALRLFEGHIIMNMGFFIYDLHQRIQHLHREQVAQYGGNTFTVYQGQAFSQMDFEKLCKNEGGLMSFNSFMSTSKQREIPLKFAEGVSLSKDKVGVLFVMTIDPNITSVPFADIQHESEYAQEAEILFSTHAVFRIGTIQHKAKVAPYFEVTLSLTKDSDKELDDLMAHLDRDVCIFDGWERMGHLLIKVGQTDEAETLFKTLLENTSNADDVCRYYHGLGMAKGHQGDYEKAVAFYEQALEIQTKSLPPNHPSLVNSYNNIGSAYDNMGEYPKALSFYEQALEIQKKSLPPNHPDVKAALRNIELLKSKSN